MNRIVLTTLLTVLAGWMSAGMADDLGSSDEILKESPTDLGDTKKAKVKKPNVLFIAIDDLNDWIGCLGGHPDTKTPNLDRLAKRGVLFTKAYCASPSCNPSRAALLTGIRPSTLGVYSNGQPWRESKVLKDAVTLPQHFMAHGYHARGGGKIFHGRFNDSASWHEWFDSGGAPPLSLKERRNPHSRAGGIVWGNLHETPVSEMPDYRLASWTADFLSKQHDRPFFVGCGFKKPHMSWQVPGSYYEKFPLDKIAIPEVPDDDLDDIPPAGLRMAKPGGDHKDVTSSDTWRNAVQGYLATINFVDDQVGRVLAALDGGPHAKNTIIILWGDHGWHLGEKKHWRKFSLWEEAAKTPLMVVVPGVTKGGRCDSPVNLLDIYPTLVELCGLENRKELEGLSLKPLLENPGAGRERPVLMTYKRGNHTIRSKRWRYIRYADGSEELYDHDKDEMEWTNLAGDPRYKKVIKDLARWLPETDAPDDP